MDDKEEIFILDRAIINYKDYQDINLEYFRERMYQLPKITIKE